MLDRQKCKPLAPFRIPIIHRIEGPTVKTHSLCFIEALFLMREPEIGDAGRSNPKGGIPPEDVLANAMNLKGSAPAAENRRKCLIAI